MKVHKLFSLFVLLLCSAIIAQPLQAQDQPAEKKGEDVIIIKKVEGKDGKVKTKKIIRSGNIENEMELHEEGDHVIIKKMKGEDGQIEVIVNPETNSIGGENNVTVKMEETDGKKHLRVRIQPEGEEEQLIEWEGEGDIPEDIRLQLKEKGVFLHQMKDAGQNVFEFEKGEGPHGLNWVADDEAPKAFLGIMSDQQTTVKVTVDENGEETTEESSPDTETTEGVRISDVVEGSAAEAAGLQAGDLLLALGGLPMQNFDDVTDFMRAADVGQEVTIQYQRNGQAQQTSAVLTERKGDMGGNVIIEKHLEEATEDGGVYRFRIKSDEDEVVKHRRIMIIKRIDDGEDAVEQTEETMPQQLATSPIENTLELQNYKLFPNPTDGKLRLRFQGEAAPLTIRITDAQGKQLYREQVNQFDGGYDEDIDLSTLPSGLLLLNIEQNGKIYTEQIILQ